MGLFAILGLVLAVVALQVYRTVGELAGANAWVDHTFQTRQLIVTTVAALRSAEAAQRAYVIGGDEARRAEAYATTAQLTDHVRSLRMLVADNPVQSDNAGKLEALLDQRRQDMARLLAIYQERGLEAYRSDPRYAQSREQDSDIDDLAARMIAQEEQLLEQRQRASDLRVAMSRGLTLVAIALCFGMLGVALFLILREQRHRLSSERRVTQANVELSDSLEESRQLSAMLGQLSGLGHMLQGCRSLDEAAVGLSATMARMFDGTCGAVNLINASQNFLAPISQWGDMPVVEAGFAPDDCWALRLGHAYPEGEPFVSAFACRHLHEDLARDLRTWLCAPLLAQGTVLGTLILVDKRAITERTRAAAIAAAEQIALAIANLRLQETLRTQSLRDPLTGLFNRRYLEVSLVRDLNSSIRRSQPLTVLMIDIDHFKRFNDEYGHEAGDALLTRFGEVLMPASAPRTSPAAMAARNSPSCCARPMPRSRSIALKTSAARYGRSR